MEKRDYIIVGKGLAGTILALELLKRGKKLWIIDNPALSACSSIAAGMFNPIVFKRLTTSWMAGNALPVMREFYEKAEKSFGTKLLHTIPIARVLTGEGEEDLWKKKAKNELDGLIDPEIHSPSGNLSFLKKNYGLVTSSGFLDVSSFLAMAAKLFRESGSLCEATFDQSELNFTKDKVACKNLEAGKIIFCEGHLSATNPFFKEVQFKPAKGEILTIRCPALKTDCILQKDIFIVPLKEKDVFRVGATYNWDDLTDMVTANAKNSLETKLKSFIPFGYSILDHFAGIRPSTIDRRPVIGYHPENNKVAIFNGFGTRAVLLAPYFAAHFCDFMENNTELASLADVKRFFPSYAKEKTIR